MTLAFAIGFDSNIDASFDKIVHYARTDEGRETIPQHIVNIERYHYNNPATTMEQETLRQNTLAAMRAALDTAERQNAADAAVKATIPVNARVSRRPEAVPDVDPNVQRLLNAMPGESFTVTDGPDSMTVEYDEDFDSFNVRTAYVVKVTSATEYSEERYVSRGEMLAKGRDLIYGSPAWRNRRTLSNPNLDRLLAREYEAQLADAAKPYTPDTYDFISTYSDLYEACQRDPNRYLASPALLEFEAKHSATLSATRNHLASRRDPFGGTIQRDRFPHPDNLALARKTIDHSLTREGVAAYVAIAAEDSARIEKARSEHTAALAQWNEEQQRRESSALRRLLPTSPPPTMPVVERKTTPHPFGGMTRDEWVGYEKDAMRLRQEDPSLNAA
jgi:hypothetical protein